MLPKALHEAKHGGKDTVIGHEPEAVRRLTLAS
jgi:hypothetical protein